VLLARVLAGQPRWLLADEPLASLDPAHQLDTLAMLRKVAGEGAGVILVLHDLTQAARVADDIILLKQGRVLASGERDAVLTAANIADAFGVEVLTARDPQGLPIIVPVVRVT
ncbi:ABC transporter ATP-binding protein, partial [Sphingomonas sp. AOB5]|uniref:ABC transporter ATP-binding protein n=1 Tax=Sphingomonas sp. AOB5 TaxID=3034017 RepID=UPI0023F739FF